jgi:hypothetical protein
MFDYMVCVYSFCMGGFIDVCPCAMAYLGWPLVIEIGKASKSR